MHLAEQEAEVAEFVAHTGLRPTEWLLANHEVTPDWCLIHCTQMTAAETSALAATGAVAGLAPLPKQPRRTASFRYGVFCLPVGASAWL